MSRKKIPDGRKDGLGSGRHGLVAKTIFPSPCPLGSDRSTTLGDTAQARDFKEVGKVVDRVK